MSRVTTTSTQSRIKGLVSAALGLIIGASSLPLKADAAPVRQYRPAANYARQTYRRPRNFMPDTLMIIPAGKVTNDQMAEVFQSNGCMMEDVIGSGPYRILIIKTQKGKLAQTEAALKKDKHVWMMQRNWQFEQMVADDSGEDVVANKKGGSGSFLTLVNAPKAWKLGPSGAGQTIAVADSGVQPGTDDLRGKCDEGYDATTWDAKLALASSPIGAGAALAFGGAIGLGLGLGLNILSNTVNPGCKSDQVTKNADGVSLNGHGTMVSTVAAGAINGQHACGVAPDARIYPIRDGDSTALCAGIWHMMTTGGPKILNISQGPFYEDQDPINFLAFRLYHDWHGGIIFVAGGNHGEQLGGPVSYVNFVSMTDTSGKFLETKNGQGSALGGCITFAAQGQMVDTVDMSNTDVSTGGTSLASPTVAGVAALVWSANPRLTGDQVVLLMKQHAYIPAGVTNDPMRYGYGIPDAEATVKAALGLSAQGLGG
jgi:subtilisin family serine protease